MKLFVFSDPHGDMPDMKGHGHYDVVCCCGDFSPLEYQRSYALMMDWIDGELCDWLKTFDYDKFILIAGNHDFCCEKPMFKEDFAKLLFKHNLAGKVVYLQNELFEYGGKTFFGCPYSDIPYWAFSMADPTLEYHKGGYYDLPDGVDVMLVHQAPDFNNVGTSDFDSRWARNFGSYALLKVIEEHQPKYVFCGHIHSGNHEKSVLDNTTIYNTSIKNEQYRVTYEPLIIEI